MLLATWNCHSGGLAKWQALEAMEVTVGVLCETTLANPGSTPALGEPPLEWVAAGNPNKAIAVVSRMPLQALPARAGEGRFTVAAQTDHDLSILGLWSCPEHGGGRAYEDEVLATLNAWGDELAAGDMIVAGDFNVGHAAGRTVDNAWVSRAHALWTELGLVSAYHVFYSEEIGSSSRATHFHTYNVNRPWHIDWVLLHRSRLPQLRSVSVGTYEEWTAPDSRARSDHVPVIVDLDV